MKHVPNLLSLSRLPLSCALFYFALQHNWSVATVIFMVALLTDALDGFIARRFHVESSLGGDVLEPMCDLFMSCAAVAGLYFAGVITIWVPIVLIVITALLQVSRSTSITKLKRHTYYLHPLFFLAVVYEAGFVYLYLAVVDGQNVWPALRGDLILWSYNFSWIAAAFFKRERVFAWLDGPPASKAGAAAIH